MNKESTKLPITGYETVLIVLMILGTVLPYSQMYLMARQGEIEVLRIFTAVFEKPVTAFIGMDMMVTAFTFLVFLVWDSKKMHIRRWWIAIICTFAVGVSLGFPFYLFIRNRQLRLGKM